MMKVVRVIGSKSGSTLVTVIVAFVMILACFAVFYRSMTLASDLAERAEQMRINNEKALSYYYQQHDASTSGGTVNADGPGGSFTLNAELVSITEPDTGITLYYFK